MFWHVFAILVAALVCGSRGQVPVCPYKECACAETVIDCSNRGLTAIPARLNVGPTYTTLLLNGNKITRINSVDSFPTKLDTIDLRDNPISNISSDSVNGVSQTIKTIKFRNSNFTELPVALEILDNLETLDFENDTVTFPATTLTKLSRSLLSLRLANVGLAGWPTWLSQFVFLRKLYLDGNTRLAAVPANVVDIWRQSLTHLSLSNTGITTISPIAVLEKLQWLDISRNKLSDGTGLSYDLIPMGNTLRYLDVSNNALTVEPRLEDLRVLTEAYLGGNRIANVNVGAFPPSVITLNVDNNLFTSIPKFLTDLPLLQNFSIQANNIAGLTAHDFPANSRITSLYLGANPIVNIDEHAFDNLRTYLTYLDLEGTKLARLPLALKTLTKLETLWVPNIPGLVCSCEEKSLAPWIVSLPTLRIVGQCGNVDIKEFIGQLSALCP